MLINWHQFNDVIILEEGKDPEPPGEISAIRFMQLM
jgi:hypothetical protein